MNIITYHSSIISPNAPNVIHLEDSLGHHVVSDQATALLDFLVFSAIAEQPLAGLKATWDLDLFVAPILHALPLDVCSDLAGPSHRGIYLVHSQQGALSSYRIFYIPNKMFSVNKAHNEVTFYDLSQYFPDDLEPTTIMALQAKADELLTAFKDLGIPAPKNLTSPVAVFESSGILKPYLSEIPTVYDLQDNNLDAAEYALACDNRDWTSNYQIGHWAEGECWTFDQSSAFPSVAMGLPDLRDCSLTYSKSMIETAYMGFVRGRLTIDPDAFCSPAIADRGDGVNVNFVGTHNDFYTLELIRFIEGNSLGSYKLKDGWFISPMASVRPRLPFKDMVEKLHSQRTQSSPLASFILKRAMNGVIGRLVQRKDTGSLGSLYNPIYHSEITNGTTVRVARFLVDNEITAEELIHVGTDGCRLTRPPDGIKTILRPGLGQWRCTGSVPTFVLSPSAVLTPDRYSNGIGYSSLLEMISAHPRATRYKVDVPHRVSLSEAVTQNDLSSIGTEYSTESIVDLKMLFLNQDGLERDIARLPRTGVDLLNKRCLLRPFTMSS